MNIAKTVTEVNEINPNPTTKTVYINILFSELARAITAEGSQFTYQYNGKGRIITLIPEVLESKYLNYTDADGKAIGQPIEVDNNSQLAFIVQPDSNSSGVKFKWKGIIQNLYDLRLASKSKEGATYDVVATPATKTNVDDVDDVIINVNFSVNGDKFLVAWDPQVRIVRV